LLTGGTYGEDFIGLPPAVRGEPACFCATPGTRRPAAVGKGAVQASSIVGGGCC
jgi:hypothetical protein